MNYRFTNRTGGVSTGSFASLNLGVHVGDEIENVKSNRAILSGASGPIQFMSQVHGNRVAVVEAYSDEDPTADALVTGIPGVVLAVQVADCIPLLLASKESVAAVHVGRKGLLNGVTLATLEIMREMGATDISAVVGPAICGSCYEVSEEIFNEVTQMHPKAAARTPQNTFSLDLPRALRAELDALDIQVRDDHSCTVEDSNLYSYRRDGATGRQAGIIWL